MLRIPYKKTLPVFIIAFSLLLANITSAPAAQKRIVAFGDSLTAGYGLPMEKSFPAQLEQKLKQQGYDVLVINAGVSGDTTSGGVTRLEWVLSQQPDFFILELGANDMLRGTDPDVTYNNLQKILAVLREKKIPVLLSGMKATPNLGAAFEGKYNKMYKTLAEEYGAVYYPFFMEGVAAHSDLLQEDGMHPNAAGAALIAGNMLPFVKKLLEGK